jgi:hypothetical protein
VTALGVLNDPKAIAVLETFDVGKDDSPKRKAVQQALTDLKSGQKPDANIKTLREDFLEIQKQNREMQEQFQEMKKRLDAQDEGEQGEESEDAA